MIIEESTKKKNTLILTLILGLALLLRILFLALKPAHFDEGINGWFVDQMYMNGFYRYEPSNYHGPLHFYLLAAFKFLFGRNLWALRLVPVIFGVGTVYLLTRFKPYVGYYVAYAAALIMAVSPAMVFYSRYSIHEMELVFFSVLAFLGFLRLQSANDRSALWQVGLGLAGMILTKETYLVHVITFFIAVWILKIYEKFIPSTDTLVKVTAQYTRRDLLLAVFTSIALVFVFYSGFFRNMKGLIGLAETFSPWFHTGFMGNGHNKPFWYWLGLLLRYEWIALAGLLLLPTLLLRSSYVLRLIGLYGFGCFLGYSIIQYKTPWCIIQFLWPLTIVAISFLINLKKPVAFITVGLFSFFTFAKTVNLNFFHYVDEQEPYVYIQTYSDIIGIMEKIENVVQTKSSKKDLRINLFLSSEWPLPWMLGDYSNIGYLGAGKLDSMQNVDAGVILVDGSKRLIFEEKIMREYFIQPFKLRSAMNKCFVYFDAQLFKDYFDDKATIVKPRDLAPLVPGPGLQARYYTNAEWTGNEVSARIVETVDFNWTDDQRPLTAPFGIIFTGEIFIPHDQEITFILNSDDGSDLYIDDREIIQNLGPHPVKKEEKATRLKKGWHKIQLRYNDYGGGMVAQLRWRWADHPEETIPSKNFRQ